MLTVVTLDVYSGKPNPTWVLTDAQQSMEITERLNTIQEPTTQTSSGALGKLGYRGFVVTPGAAQLHGAFHVHEGIVNKGLQEANVISRNRELETFLLSTAGESLPIEVRGHVEAELKAPAADVTEFFRWPPRPPHCPHCNAADAPVYNPGAWNIPAVQPFNNCYNYANNQITGTFAQPGRAHGYVITNLRVCNGAGTVEPGAHADGLVNTPNFHAALAPGHGWYVAVVIWPGVDYHWYRQDKVGCWSHKPGSTPVRNVDNAGNAIIDPALCNRGPYTIFCTYMITKHGVVIR